MLPPHKIDMNKFDINAYSEQLMQLCAVCKRANKCKDKSKICFAKWTTFKVAKLKYKSDLKKAG